MYESYSWPGAYSLKDEAKLIVKQFKELFDGILKEIQKNKDFEENI